jgi:hypothetical protein
VTNASTTVIVDLINVIIVIIGPTIAMMIGIDVIITMTTTATTDVTTIVTMTTMIGAMTARMIVMTTSAMIAETTDVMTDVAKTTTTTMTTIEKNELHHHCLKRATPIVRSNLPTKRSISSSAVAKRPKATDRTDQTPGRSNMSTLKPHNLCVGPNFQSLSPRKIIGFTSLTPGLTRRSLIP